MLPTGLGAALFAGPSQRMGVAYDADAAALFARMTTPPDATRKTACNVFVTGLKDAGLWPRGIGLWALSAHDAQAARRNWLADQYNLTAVNSPTFTTDRGYTGDGSSSRLSTGFNAFTAADPNFTVNSACFGIFIRTPASVAYRRLMSAETSVRTQLSTGGNAGETAAALNTSSYSNQTIVAGANTAQKLVMIDRSSGTQLRTYLNGVAVNPQTIASDAIANAIMTLLANPDGVYAANAQLSGAAIWGSMTGPEHLQFYNLFLAYQQAVGAA